VCNKKIKHTDLCYFHLQLTWLDWSRSRSFWSQSHNRFLVSSRLGRGLTIFWSH